MQGWQQIFADNESLSDTGHYWCNRYRPEAREISRRSLLWYRGDHSLELDGRRCTIVDNSINNKGQNRCKFDSTVLVDPVWNSINHVVIIDNNDFVLLKLIWLGLKLVYAKFKSVYTQHTRWRRL